jgi:magnesium-transporting ATPase (P-type)
MQVTENDRENAPNEFNNNYEIQSEMKDLLKEAIVSNTDVRIEAVDDGDVPRYEPKGQPIEVGMIQFLIDNEEDVQNIFINRNRYTPKIVQLPFDQALKRKIVVRQINGNPEYVRVYVKGAPELIVPMCEETLNFQVNPT